jgi:TRAP-type C4-dicarboxylate transport system permease small subunit
MDPTPQQNAATEAAQFVAKFNDIILFPTIALLMGVAFFVFLWGCAQYFFNSANDQARQEGVKNITFGIIGLVVMVSAFAILEIFTGTFDLADELDCAQDPTATGCEDVFTFPEDS